MKKSILVLFLLVFLLTGCSTIASLVGLDGMAGFDKQSEKKLDEAALNIDYLADEDVMATLKTLCKDGGFSVNYNDRQRTVDFISFGSPIRLRASHNRIEVVCDLQVSYDGIPFITTDGWLNPTKMTLECYGESITDRIGSDEYKTTNDSYYDNYLKKTVYIRYQELWHVLSPEATAFLNENWSNNPLFVTITGGKTYSTKYSNTSFMALYRVLYEALFPYQFLESAAAEAVIGFVGEQTSLTQYQAQAINYYIGLNTELPTEDVRTLKNLVTSKVR